MGMKNEERASGNDDAYKNWSRRKLIWLGCAFILLEKILEFLMFSVLAADLRMKLCEALWNLFEPLNWNGHDTYCSSKP